MMISSIWAIQPGEYFCVSTKSRSGVWRDNFFGRDELISVDKFVRDNADKDIYFCPHGFSRKRRVKEYAVPPRMLYADLDEVDPRGLELKPSIAIESSPGRFVGLWLMDKKMPEDLNRRLTYAIGADHGGWDLTQVLRYPSTTNYKYTSAPRVRMLWDDGPIYRLAELERRVPERAAKPAVDGGGAKDIYKAYERKLPSWARRELLNGKPTRGKRSEVFWKLGHALVDAGMSHDEWVCVMGASPWNKFAGRSSEGEQLEREYDKIVGERVAGNTEPQVNGYKFLQHPIQDVEEEEVDWLWYPYLARGEVTLLEGDPGTGKSWVSQIIAKHIVDGEKLPALRPGKVACGNVAYFDVENDPARVTKPRLRWNNCRHMERFYQDPQPFSIEDEDDMAHVHDALEQVKPTLVVFDTINLYIGRIDTAKSNEVTQAMQPFVNIARAYNCAVIVIRHLTKSSGGNKALYRGQGNIAFSAVARIQMTIGWDPEDDETNVLSVTKLNLAMRPKALTFTKRSAPLLKEPDRCLFEWGDWVDYTSDDILGTPKKAEVIDGAKAFLEEMLDEEAIDVRKLEVMAEKRSISKRTLYRAADALGVVKTSKGFGNAKTSVWALPE